MQGKDVVSLYISSVTQEARFPDLNIGSTLDRSNITLNLRDQAGPNLTRHDHFPGR